MNPLCIALLADCLEPLQPLAASLAMCAPDSLVLMVSDVLALLDRDGPPVDLVLWHLPSSADTCGAQLRFLKTLPQVPAVAFCGTTQHLEALEQACQLLEIRYQGHFLLPLSHSRLQRMLLTLPRTGAVS